MEKEWINYWNALKEVEKEKQELIEKNKNKKDRLTEEIFMPLLDNAK